MLIGALIFGVLVSLVQCGKSETTRETVTGFQDGYTECLKRKELPKTVWAQAIARAKECLSQPHKGKTDAAWIDWCAEFDE
jgi:hypothetical protein